MCRVIVMGACPHDDHAQSSNWGIFNQHIWGDYNQHSHARRRPRRRRRQNAFLQARIGIITRLAGAHWRRAGRHDNLFVRWKLHDLAGCQ
ncbi:hypothetical protein KRIGEM_03337 [Komagataeibacter rhaeticus]|nr:hypothetical protein KRIGEM_03337 [Komagataeibacter rhaeticus]